MAEEQLKLRQVIKLHGNTFRVCQHYGQNRFFLSGQGGACNDQVFIDAGLHGEKHKIVQDITGKMTYGNPWPEVTSLEDLTKVVNVIRGTV